MACRTFLFDAQENRIGIAIDANFDDILMMTALLSFSPEFAARSTVVRRVPRAPSLMKRIAVHPSQHQNLVGMHILRDGGQESVDASREIRFALVVGCRVHGYGRFRISWARIANRRVCGLRSCDLRSPDVIKF
jgi:hypothetical protein